MNEKLEFIFSRRSIRKYKDKEISDDIINELLKAGMSAPSAMNKDPWHFIVVKKRERLDEIAEALPNGKMLKGAAALLIVCGDIDAAHGNLESYMIQDCTAAVENILLAINSLGLGACWLGVHPREERVDALKRIFSLPENIIPLAGISLGWPDEEKEARTRYNESLVHWEEW